MQWGEDAASRGGIRRLAGRIGLSGRLLLLTVVFVLIAEVLIYVPSVASYRRSWLSDRSPPPRSPPWCSTPRPGNGSPTTSPGAC